jgi:hypothetical protein
MIVSDRLYEALMTFEGKKLVATFKTEDGIFVTCNSKDFSFDRDGDLVTLNFHKLTQINLDLEKVDHYSLVCNANEYCEKFIVLTNNGAELEITLEIEENHTLVIEPLNPEDEDEDETDHFGSITKNQKIKL